MGNNITFKKLRKTGMTVVAAILAVAAITAASFAYWTDRIDLNNTVGTLDIGIQYAESALNIANGQVFVPGQKSDFAFTVNNTGKTSVDIKPVISIKSSKPMKLGTSEFMLVNSSGVKAEDEYNVEYFLKGAKVQGTNAAGFDTAVYTGKKYTTLAGKVQKDATLDKDIASGQVLTNKAYSSALKLNEKAANDFMNASAEISIKTYAVQHRNTDELRKNDDWMTSVTANPGTGV